MQIIQDIKTFLTLTILMLWDLCTEIIISSIFLFLDIQDLKASEEYAKIIFWYLGSFCLTVYGIYRAIDMMYKSRKSRLELEIMQSRMKNLNDTNENFDAID